MELAQILGASVEILQAFALIYDDVMDQSSTRRGRPCWYKQDDVGLQALNDGVILKNECFHTLKLFFGHKKSYLNIMETFHEMMRYTTYGQHMDMASNCNNTGPRFDLFTKSRYETIVKYKTSYYTFVLPVRLAMYLFGMESKSAHRQAEELLLKIGYLFQIQDDFIDCFGDPTVTGKQGSDIADGKCCWPVVRALELCDESQRRDLVANYGMKCEQNVNKCKEIFIQLNLRDVYLKEELTIYEEICGDLQNLKNHNKIMLSSDSANDLGFRMRPQAWGSADANNSNPNAPTIYTPIVM
ncbi:unnamed protein product [Oppiella nova]|uniref:Farnesyl pyrophosphate synthase n=1 Tax=Oppiella nova TaxID=334625 RepID=A0A7R9LUQ5_9ACAR|nr:unnamed protein product [Oppiella nova]CAG2167130.1 unnamed protein product [Oppiella nova]